MKDTILVEDAGGEICPMNFTHAINVFIALIRERIFGSMQKARMREVNADEDSD
jgi:hypothetical protein